MDRFRTFETTTFIYMYLILRKLTQTENVSVDGENVLSHNVQFKKSSVAVKCLAVIISLH